jgi:hypothetical protein
LQTTYYSVKRFVLIEHIDGKDKSTGIVQEAIKVKNSKDENLKKQTQERYVQALIWNKKIQTAEPKKISE